MGMKGQIGAVKTKTSTMQSHMQMAQTMKSTAGVMGQMNKQMNPQVFRVWSYFSALYFQSFYFHKIIPFPFAGDVQGNAGV